MQELGVPASLRTLMADSANGCDTVGEAWPLIHKTLTGALKRRKSTWPQKGVHALVGPSGSGKTLMVARMAMAASAKVRAEDMAIISMADAKAGAWSQLQVLAAQSGVACYRAADVATLDMLLQELSHLSVIWVDTPGTDFMQQAQALQSINPAVHLHAVLPLDATVTNVRKIFDTAELKWASVMLTKLDEAANPWHVLKALCDRALDVSAVGASHQVRVAPQAFDGQAIVDLAMEGLRPQGLSVPQQEEPVKKTRRRATATKTRATAKAAVVHE
jgi:flagellar biosynthesis GTPase FlhF